MNALASRAFADPCLELFTAAIALVFKPQGNGPIAQTFKDVRSGSLPGYGREHRK
jgi:hypothetical protein